MIEKETGGKWVQQFSQGKLVEEYKVTADWTLDEVVEWAATFDEMLPKILQKEKIR